MIRKYVKEETLTRQKFNISGKNNNKIVLLFSRTKSRGI